MKSHENRIRELEKHVALLLRELSRVNSRSAAPFSPRLAIYLCKTDAAINKGASGTCSIWDGPEGSEGDTTKNITGVYNRWANVGSGKWVLVAVFRGRKYLIAGECPLT